MPVWVDRYRQTEMVFRCLLGKHMGFLLLRLVCLFFSVAYGYLHTQQSFLGMVYFGLSMDMEDGDGDGVGGNGGRRDEGKWRSGVGEVSAGILDR
jgi:cadmium resistance protein CadD (predicted permease)